MKTIINKDIAEYTGKSIDTVNGWKQKQPKLLKVAKLGSLCIKNGIDENKLKNLIHMQELIKTTTN